MMASYRLKWGDPPETSGVRHKNSAFCAKCSVYAPESLLEELDGLGTAEANGLGAKSL